VNAPEDSPADPADEERFVQAVEERFRELRGSPLLLSPADFQRALGWFRQGVPLFVVLEALDDVFRRAAERVPARVPRSLRYVEPAVVEGLERWREGRVGARRAVPGIPDEAELIERTAAAVEESAAPASARARAAAELRALVGSPGTPGQDRVGLIANELVAACMASLCAAERAALKAEAAVEVAPYAGAMSEEVRARASAAALARRVRRRFSLPDLALLPLV
jgi:hypothetical protein